MQTPDVHGALLTLLHVVVPLFLPSTLHLKSPEEYDTWKKGFLISLQNWSVTRLSIRREPWDCQSAILNHWFRTLRSRLYRCWGCPDNYHWPSEIHPINSSPENRTHSFGCSQKLSIASGRDLKEGACVRALAPHRGAVRTSLEVREC